MKRLIEYIGILFGVIMISFGIHFLQEGSLVIGGTVGLGILLYYLTDIPSSIYIFCISIPFYVISWMYIGKVFTFRTLVSVTLLTLLSDYFSKYLPFGVHSMFINAVFGGACIGIGVYTLMKSKASIGGVMILAEYFHEKRNWNKGVILFSFDALVISSALIRFPVEVIVFSLVSTIIVSFIVSNKGKVIRRFPVKTKQTETM